MDDEAAVFHYLTMVKNLMMGLLLEEQRLIDTNLVLAGCHVLGIPADPEYLNIGAIGVFLELLKVCSMDLRGGSVVGRRANIDRQREKAYYWLLEDYFVPHATYPRRSFDAGSVCEDSCSIGW